MPLRHIDRTPTAFAMVGLPARGKTYIARKVARYLSWVGHSTRVFNVGSYRRRLLGSHHTHDFFDPTNEGATRSRADMAQVALDDMLSWLDEGGEVAIYDATNSTRERRRVVLDQCTARGVPVAFIESVCNDPAVVEANIRETKLKSPEYEGYEPEEAARDFRARIAHYESAYEPLEDAEASYIKIINVGQKLVLNRISGYLPARLAPLLIDMHVTPRPIWLTRHGESLYNEAGILGGDSALSARGEAYSHNLAEFVRRSQTGARAPGKPSPLAVWTSSLKRTIQTAAPLTSRPVIWRALDEIDAGVCEGMTYDEIRQRMPEVHAARSADKFGYRYPRGESYEDVIQRLDPLLIQLERQRTPVLVIAHQAVLRALYAYFKDLPPSECPNLSIPLHTVIQLVPTPFGCEERRFPLAPLINDDPKDGAPVELGPPD